MITVPVEDFVFIICALVGGGLLLITVLVDDILGGVLDSMGFGFDIGGISLMPLLLGFVSMFGVGGLFATQILDVHGGQAALIGAVSGSGGFAIVYVMFSILRRAEGAAPFTMQDLVGRSGSVAVGIQAGRLGSVYVKAEGQTHEITATSSVDLAPGSVVTVTAVAGNTLVVAALVPVPPAGAAGQPVSNVTPEGSNDRA
jgi:membrane protein implicated in regulation of membrane protease activity